MERPVNAWRARIVIGLRSHGDDLVPLAPLATLLVWLRLRACWCGFAFVRVDHNEDQRRPRCLDASRRAMLGSEGGDWSYETPHKCRDRNCAWCRSWHHSRCHPGKHRAGSSLRCSSVDTAAQASEEGDEPVRRASGRKLQLAWQVPRQLTYFNAPLTAVQAGDRCTAARRPDEVEQEPDRGRLSPRRLGLGIRRSPRVPRAGRDPQCRVSRRRTS